VLAKQSPCLSLWDDDVTSRGFMSQIGTLSVTWMLSEKFIAVKPTQNATGLQCTLQRSVTECECECECVATCYSGLLRERPGLAKCRVDKV